MLIKLALISLVLGVVAGFFGFARFSGKLSFGFARVLSFLFVAIFVLLVLVQMIR